jgi:hypothetical protein
MTGDSMPMKDGYTRKFTGTFIVRCDPGLMQAFDELGKLLEFDSRMHFIRHLMKEAVTGNMKAISTIDPEDIKKMLLAECQKLIDARVYTLFMKGKDNVENDI